MTLFTPLTLPNGTVIPNRIAKAAMEENMATAEQTPSAKLIELYRRWADGGSGLLISGNVMVDGHAMTGPGGVVLQDSSPLEPFRQWARAGQSGGGQFWLQINHPGRQMPAALQQPSWAPSQVPVELGKLSKHFSQPREMPENMIQEVIRRFVRTAQLAEQAGFNGVQIHAAHGYLISQFLSPLTNKRSDHWGGSLANRARLLLEIVSAIRAAVSADFTLAVKLNSADFQRGGFSQDDARQVVALLNQQQVELVELSGGSYEAPAMHGRSRDDRSLAREAYFLEFAADISELAEMPLMVTGGIRRLPVAQQVVESGIAMAGIATALAIDPQLPNHWHQGRASAPQLAPIHWNNKPLASLAYMAMVKYQLNRHSKQRPAKPQVSPLWALLGYQLENALLSRRYRRRMARLANQPPQL